MARLCEQFYPSFDRPIYNWTDFVSVMRQLPTLDHIARARRKVIEKHNKTKYLPTVWEIAEARKINVETWKQYARQKDIPLPPKMSISNNIPEEYKHIEHEL